MAETGKRIEVRCGAFACSVDGFDDPVGQLREVLALVQRMITETPALADEASELDEAQFARIHQALSDRRAAGADGDSGVIVVRSGERSAEVGSGARAGAAGAPSRDEAPPADVGAQGPLGAELPEESATPAALFSAPAAGVAETAFSAGLAAADPADTDDDAGDPDLALADEAVEERVRDMDAERAPAIGFGGPGDGWTPWGSAAAAQRPEVPSQRSPAGAERGASATGAGETGDSLAGRTARQPAPTPQGSGGGGSLPAINIFAAPPEDPSEAEQPDAQTADILAAPRPEPLASLRREPGPAAAQAEIAPGTPVARPAQSGDVEEDAASEDEHTGRDEAAGDGAGASGDPSDQPKSGPQGSAETRLAALITRYRSGLEGGAKRDARPDAAGSLSPADLARRAEATEVSDLLAVSAAWLALAQGRARFSRREVMRVFERLPGDHPRTLEARVTGFGKLVRTGTLQLVDEGAFALAPHEHERFRALIDQG